MKRSDLSSIEPEIITGWLSDQQMQHDAHVWHWRRIRLLPTPFDARGAINFDQRT